MTKGEDSHSEMARQSDGIDVVFNQNSPASSRSRSRSSSGSRPSSGSGRYRGRGSYRRRYRSSSSSSRSSSHTRSRSHPRCYRPSSRCRCDNHRRHGRRQSPPRRYRAHSGSYSRSPSPVRPSNNRRHRSRSRSSSRRYRRDVNRFSQSPPRTHRSYSRSGSSGHSVNLNVDDKGEFKPAKYNATPIQRAEKLAIPVSVKPNLSVESKQLSPERWVRQNPEKTQSQSSEEESDDFCSPKMSPKRKGISFSLNNSLVKPIVAAPSCAKVTSRVDSYESRKPYGHWVPVRSGRTSNARKHTLAMSR